MFNNEVLFFFLRAEFTTVKGRVCETPSKTWFGNCKDTKRCDQQCIEWEDAKHGACHERESKFMCFCYYACGPKNPPPPPPGTPPPPPTESTPPQPPPPDSTPSEPSPPS
ncbi:hypothetical protein OSB04_006269 [Centaurea solstitialis]|uniref:Knottins-like domain-containing protein n=1 Tax=Centaurea solstitialis TaxID=347529 RepID=A0AA38WRX4_9ASTR|nr:hypothetical protein OSB04_006269 [Centaurea solstitialis]